MSTHSSQGSSQIHYTITRSTSRRGPHYINCLNSDANASKWKETGPVIDNTGATCYWKSDDDESLNLSEKWKRSLGKIVAKLLGLTDDASDEDWRIQDLPKDYKIFRHVKGQREDCYLFGSEWVTKFRTANEFSPHFHWLCTHEPIQNNRIHCKCKYCSGSKNQGLVNSSLGISENSKRFSSPILDQKSSSQNKRKAEEDMLKENARKKMASDSNSSNKPQRIPSKPLSSRKSLPNNLSNSLQNGPVSNRKSTFAGPYVNKDRDRDLSELKCTFRMAELVWCQLDTPIQATAEGRPDLRIDYWPAICEERVLVSNPQLSDSSSEPSKGNKSTSSLSLKIQQKFQWKVRLLATSDMFCKDESQLLAYLNYPPPLNIYKLPIDSKGLKHIHDGHDTDRPSIASFSTFSEALAPFALSLQITAHIKKSFTLMDRYDIALLKRLEARGQNIPIEDIQILYEDSNLPWYQYIWWGAEKIWSGELIRLIVTASDLPSGLRPLTQDDQSRCFFLKISGFYRSANEQGMVKGAIFELSPIAQRAKDEAEKNPEFEESDLIPNVQQSNRYMPEAPVGYFFRRLTPVGKEHHLVLQHIAGRYYPPRHPIIIDPSNSDQSGSPAPFSFEGRSLILSGFGEGRWLHMHCETWALDRKECFKESESSAERELIAFCENPRVEETIKTKSVAVIESEMENGTIMQVLENGIDTVANNHDLAMNANSVDAIEYYMTNGHKKVGGNATLDDSKDNVMITQPNNATPHIYLPGPKEDKSAPLGVTEAENNVTLAANKRDEMNTGSITATIIYPHVPNLSAQQENTVNLGHTTADKNLTAEANKNEDMNLRPKILNLIDPRIANLSLQEENATPICHEKENKVVSPDRTRVENDSSLTESKKDETIMQPKTTTIDPRISNLSVQEDNAIPPGHPEVLSAAISGHAQLENNVPPAERENSVTNTKTIAITSPDSHMVVSIEKEGNALPLSHSEAENVVTVVESKNNDVNLEPSSVTCIDHHVAIISSEKGKPLGDTQVETESSTVNCMDPKVAITSSQKEEPLAHTQAEPEPASVTCMDPHVAIIADEKEDPLGRIQVETEPSTVTCVNPHVAIISSETDEPLGRTQVEREPSTVTCMDHQGAIISGDKEEPLGHKQVETEPSTVNCMDPQVSIIPDEKKGPLGHTQVETEPSTVTDIDTHFANLVEKGEPLTNNKTTMMEIESAQSHVADGSRDQEEAVTTMSTTNDGLIQEPDLEMIHAGVTSGNTFAQG